MLSGSYNLLFVVLSVLISILASFTALSMASRVASARSRHRAGLWLAGGGIAMGAGIWSMHFLGMLAFQLPIPLGYELWLTLQSLLAAVASSLLALWLASRPTLPHLHLLVGGLLMGMGIAWMHYSGMAALQMQPAIVYDRFWLALSISIAIAASWSALFIAFRMRSNTRPLRTRIAAATVMGMAIAGMHYTAMLAARFPEGSVSGAAGAGGLHTEWIAISVVALTLVVSGALLLIALAEERMQAQLLAAQNSLLSASLDNTRKELFHATLHDPLTGLPNRQLARERLELLGATPGTDDGKLAVFSLDLDDLRLINSAFGHQAGDAVLVAMADRLRQYAAGDRLVGRLGGDHFILATRVRDEAGAMAVAGHIMALVNSLRVGNRDIQVTASIGYALLDTAVGSIHLLLSQAETAMRHAKQAGNNSCLLFAEWMNDSVEQDLQLLADLRDAIGSPELALYYQPRIHAGSGRVCGAEALLRWQHPEHGPVPSERVLRLAEQYGLIDSLGQWILEEACRQLRHWHDAGNADWRVSLNLSRRQLRSETLAVQIGEVLRLNALEPSQLILEISESAVTRHADTPTRQLHALAALGVGISIDDFGTGFSSLLRLRRIPATELKIDRAFILAVDESDEDVVIVSAVIALGHALNLDVVAEGIETQGQRTYIERLGCDYLQGNGLGQPVSAHTFQQLYGAQAQASAHCPR